MALVKLNSPSLEESGTGEKTYLEAAISRVASASMRRLWAADRCRRVEDGSVEVDKAHRLACCMEDIHIDAFRVRAGDVVSVAWQTRASDAPCEQVHVADEEANELTPLFSNLFSDQTMLLGVMTAKKHLTPTQSRKSSNPRV